MDQKSSPSESSNQPHQPLSPPAYQPPPNPPAESDPYANLAAKTPAAPQPNPNPSGGVQPQAVYVARPMTPPEQVLTPEQKQRHENSKRLYPELNLSDGEYVISAVRRHPIGLLSIWLVVALIIFLTFFGLPFYADNTASFAKLVGLPPEQMPSVALVAIPFLIFTVLVVLGGLVATYVYLQNKFFLTNESVIQFIQVSLFSKKEQTISLTNIEDASYRQHGILQTLLNYGNIRLSTQGEETTYRFSYVTNPKRQIALLNDAVEAFKNGRPVSENS